MDPPAANAFPLDGNEYLPYFSQERGCDGVAYGDVERAGHAETGPVTASRGQAGERVEFETLPGGELKVRAARPRGTIESFIGRHAGKLKKPLTIEEMNEISAAGWARELDGE